MTASENPFDQLMALIQRLRAECPWDRKQTAESMAPHLTEEAYELVDAISSGSHRAVREELGDVLFQLFFIARLYEESDHFDMGEVTAEIMAKMIRRHPHVFGEGRAANAGEVKSQWDRIKAEEKKGAPAGSRLASVPVGLPALSRGYRILDRISRLGFSRSDVREPVKAAEEKWTALGSALSDGRKTEVSAALGSLLLELMGVARDAGVHPETALSEAVRQLQHQFEVVEKAALARGIDPADLPPEEKEAFWKAVDGMGPSKGKAAEGD